MNFAVGSLVKVRDREWVVLPESNEEMLDEAHTCAYGDESVGAAF